MNKKWKKKNLQNADLLGLKTSPPSFKYHSNSLTLPLCCTFAKYKKDRPAKRFLISIPADTDPSVGWKDLKGALKNNRTCRRAKGPARHEEIWCWDDETYKNVSEKRRLSGVKKRRPNKKKYLDVKKKRWENCLSCKTWKRKIDLHLLVGETIRNVKCLKWQRGWS